MAYVLRRDDLVITFLYSNLPGNVSAFNCNQPAGRSPSDVQLRGRLAIRPNTTRTAFIIDDLVKSSVIKRAP